MFTMPSYLHVLILSIMLIIWYPTSFQLSLWLAMRQGCLSLSWILIRACMPSKVDPSNRLRELNILQLYLMSQYLNFMVWTLWIVTVLYQSLRVRLIVCLFLIVLLLLEAIWLAQLEILTNPDLQSYMTTSLGL